MIGAIALVSVIGETIGDWWKRKEVTTADDHLLYDGLGNG